MRLTKRQPSGRPKGLWMYLPEAKRIKMLTLMTIHGASGRQMAKVAGWRSHTYMQRLLRGEVRTLDTEPAVAIAHFLGVPVEELFDVKREESPEPVKRRRHLPSRSRVSGGSVQEKRAS